MRAVAVVEMGSAAQVIDVKTPTPEAGEIRVGLRAAGVNPVDGESAGGAYGQVELPFIPGIDGAGEVDMLGEGSTAFAPGDRVFGRLGRSGHGTYAEYVVVPESGVIARIPAGLEFRAAAALPVAGLTALGVLRGLDFPLGARLLVVGATGGVGSFLVQLAVRAGLEVVATARTEYAERMRGFGAAATIDHSSPLALREQMSQMGMIQLGGLADLVGDRQLVADLAALVRPGGRVVSTAGGVDPARLAAQQINGSNFRGASTAAMLEELGSMAASGDIEVPIEREVRMDDAPQVLQESRSGHLHGKTVLLIGQDA